MRKLTLLTLVLLLIIPMVATAQDDWQTYSDANGSFEYSPTWELHEKDVGIELSNTTRLFERDENVFINTLIGSGEILVLSGAGSGDSDNQMVSEDVEVGDISTEFLTGYMAGVTTVAYQLQFLFSQEENNPRLQITDLSILDMPYENSLVVLSDGTVDIMLFIAFSRDDDGTILNSAIFTLYYLTEDKSLHDENIMHFLQSIALAGG